MRWGAGKKRQLLKLNPVHLAKLRTQYEDTRGASIAEDDSEEEQAFGHRVLSPC